jgi:hypothetical protein
MLNWGGGQKRRFDRANAIELPKSTARTKKFSEAGCGRSFSICKLMSPEI